MPNPRTALASTFYPNKWNLAEIGGTWPKQCLNEPKMVTWGASHRPKCCNNNGRKQIPIGTPESQVCRKLSRGIRKNPFLQVPALGGGRTKSNDAGFRFPVPRNSTESKLPTQKVNMKGDKVGWGGGGNFDILGYRTCGAHKHSRHELITA